MNLIKTLAAGAFASLLAFAGSALASPVLWISVSGFGPVTVTDGGIGDTCAAVDCVTFNGTIGGFTVIVTTGITGLGGHDGIDLNAVVVSSGAGTIVMQYGDTDFTLGAGPHVADIIASIGGTVGSGGTLTALECVNDNNANPAGAGCALTGGALGAFGGPGAFAGTNVWYAPVDGTFALGQQVIVTHTGAAATSFDAELRIPEPGTLALLGLGLLGFGLSRRRSS